MSTGPFTSGNTTWTSNGLRRKRPDIVINEMLERFFNIRDPKKIMELEALD